MRKNKQPKTNRRRVNFTIFVPDAQHVSLVGNFNNWDTKKHPMRKDNRGQWQKTVVLKPGTYEYKFWVDGEWMLDAGNENRCANNFGTMNSFVTVLPYQQ